MPVFPQKSSACSIEQRCGKIRVSIRQQERSIKPYYFSAKEAQFCTKQPYMSDRVETCKNSCIYLTTKRKQTSPILFQQKRLNSGPQSPTCPTGQRLAIIFICIQQQKDLWMEPYSLSAKETDSVQKSTICQCRIKQTRTRNLDSIWRQKRILKPYSSWGKEAYFSTKEPYMSLGGRARILVSIWRQKRTIKLYPSSAQEVRSSTREPYIYNRADTC